MPRTTTDLKSKQYRIRLSPSEVERLRKSAEALNIKMSEVLLRGLCLVEAEIAKGQAPAQK